MNTKKNIIYQFKITLNEIEPHIWRRLQVPANCSFWDLHVAIQDSMGWLDYHLHEFRIHNPRRRKMTAIGIPDDDFDDNLVLPGWEIPIIEYFTEPGNIALYKYDFGDGWNHEVLLEGIFLKEKGVRYPKCIAGERSCPPEDCGGIYGYFRFLEIIKNPYHEEHQEMVGWLRGHAKNYYPYHPNEFDPQQVIFDNPKKRWKRAFCDP